MKLINLTECIKGKFYIWTAIRVTGYINSHGPFKISRNGTTGWVMAIIFAVKSMMSFNMKLLARGYNANNKFSSLVYIEDMMLDDTAVSLNGRCLRSISLTMIYLNCNQSTHRKKPSYCRNIYPGLSVRMLMRKHRIVAL